MTVAEHLDLAGVAAHTTGLVMYLDVTRMYHSHAFCRLDRLVADGTFLIGLIRSCRLCRAASNTPMACIYLRMSTPAFSGPTSACLIPSQVGCAPVSLSLMPICNRIHRSSFARPSVANTGFHKPM
jgi:hypothetical protein